MELSPLPGAARRSRVSTGSPRALAVAAGSDTSKGDDMGFVGMSTDQVWAHTERLRTAEQRLTSAYVQLDGAVQASRGFWRGPDAEAFQVTWNDGAAPSRA